MASGYSGGGGGGSINGGGNPSQPTYRQSHQPFNGIFQDQTTARMAPHNTALPSLVGKRTLADFQAQRGLHSALFARSIKPRTVSPVSSPLDASALSQRYGLNLFQQIWSLPSGFGLGSSDPSPEASLGMNRPIQYPVQPPPPPPPPPQVSDTSMMSRLQELEKELLDDNDEGDDVSVITNTNSEWSETIQSLINNSNPNPNSNLCPISPSSSSSSASSSTAASPAHTCSRQTVMEVATAIAEGNLEVAAETLARLSHSPSPTANSEQKVVDFVLSALKSRVTPIENPPPVTEPYRKDQAASTRLLQELSPCFKLGSTAANHAILDATVDDVEACSGFHVIDFDIRKGGQYVHLLHALATRHARPTAVKITAVGDPSAPGDHDTLRAVGNALTTLAERLGLRLAFNSVVISRIGDINRESLGCGADEPVVVNLAFKMFRVPDESVCTENPRDELLRRVKGLAPRVVTLVEQEMNANTAPFKTRVAEAIEHYAAVLDSINCADRAKVEGALRRRVSNMVACEGRERVERCEVFGKWRARMSMAGFESKPLGQGVVESIRTNQLNHAGFGLTVKEETGRISFCWAGRTIAVASAWR